MNTFINPKDINLLCNAPKYGGKYNNEALTGDNKDADQQSESKLKPGKWSVFKRKCKIFWGEAKKIVMGIADVLGTVTVLAKAVTDGIKISKKMKGVFA